jgi:uncharacterized phage protein gp47/JayE
MAKSAAEIAADLEAAIKTRLPTADTSEGSVLRDVCITAPAIPLAFLHSRIDLATRAQSIETAYTDREVEGLAKNFGLTRRRGFKAKGTVTFYTDSYPGPTLNTGLLVATKTAEVAVPRRFRTTQSVSSVSWAFDATLGKYKVTVAIEAEEVGVSWMVPAYTITSLVTSLPGVGGCYNAVATGGGSDQETISSLRNRVRSVKRGLNKGTLGYYYSQTINQDNVEEALAVGAGSTYMTRAPAGAVDVFVVGSVPATVTETFDLGSGPPYADIIPSYQPMVTLPTSVTGSVAFVEGVHYQWVQDTGSVGGSYRARDTLEWIDSYGSSMVTVTYEYNQLVRTLQALYLDTANRVEGVDVLIREALRVGVTVDCSVRLASGYTVGGVTTAISLVVTQLLAIYTIGQRVEESAILATIMNTAGVSSVLSPLNVFRSTDSVLTKDSLGGLAIPTTSYARVDVVTVKFV